MATNKNINETGWFYHAPGKRSDTSEPIMAPRTSQIPQLNPDWPEDPAENQKVTYFRDTDTKYIRLAKQGGIPNLLEFKDYRPKSHEAKGYPRVSWYYLLDNEVEDEKEKEDMNWQFGRPDYMVHQDYKPKGDNYNYAADNARGRRQAPYASATAEQLNEHMSMKIPEPRPAGYGVRNSKPLPPISKSKKTQPDKVKPINRQGELDKAKMTYVPLPASDTTSHPPMGKILSYEYEREWQEKISKWQDKQEKLREKKEAAGKEEVTNSEYKDMICRGTVKTETHSHNPRKDKKKADHVTAGLPRQNSAEQRPELFKLSKFRNVSARVDSHRNNSGVHAN